MLLALVPLAFACGACLMPRRPAVPEKVETVGPFEIVTRTRQSLSGWNEGPLRWTGHEDYAVRYRGAPFAFSGRAGLFRDTTARYEHFNAVITFETLEPAFIVNVGDPNNRSFFYLIREVDGAATATFLAETSGGVSADWIGAADSVKVRDVAVHRRHLGAGRLMLLGEYCVFDVQTLTAYALSRHPGASLNQFKPPIAVSPDRRSLVRFGYGPSPENAPLLVVFGFHADTSYALSIDQRRMRFNGWEEIDGAWLEHHFAWQPDAQGRDGLVPRPDAAPLPYRGRLTVDPADGYHEYRLERVQPEMRARFVAFLEDEFGAERLTSPNLPGADDLRIAGQLVHAYFYDGTLSVWMDRGTDARLVADIARRFDKTLRTGAYDALFAR